MRKIIRGANLERSGIWFGVFEDVEWQLDIKIRSQGKVPAGDIDLGVINI
jgi:hypothetical protein